MIVLTRECTYCVDHHLRRAFLSSDPNYYFYMIAYTHVCRNLPQNSHVLFVDYITHSDSH